MIPGRKTWIVGCGDIGLRLHKLLRTSTSHKDQTIHALTRSDASAATCRAAGLQVLQHDLSNSNTLEPALFSGSDVYYFAPPPKQGIKDQNIRQFLERVGTGIRRIVLISTTGVYGDCQGRWIDEAEPLKPQTDRAKRRVDAEQSLIAWAGNTREYIILRVPGIYAPPDRLPLARLQKGLPVVRQSEAAYTNRIHADDLAQICYTAMQSSINEEIINTTDGQPGTMVDYFNRIADYAGLARPPQISLQQASEKLSAGMLSYAQESRRIGNAKLLKLLDIKLKYPTLDSALFPRSDF